MKLSPIAATILAATLSSSVLASDYYVVVPVKNRVGTQQIQVALATASVPSGIAGSAYTGFDFNQALQVTGDANFSPAGVTWSVTGGALPAGLSLSSGGLLTGAPTTAGTYSFTLTATYKTVGGTQSYSLVVSQQIFSASLTADSSATFGPVGLNTSVTKTFTFRNTGNQTLTGVYATGGTSGFSMPVNLCGTSGAQKSIAVGATCNVSMTFNASAPGTYPATLKVYSTAAGSPTSLSLSGTAQGTYASLTSGSAAMYLGSVVQGATAPTSSWSFKNNGNLPMTLSVGGLSSPFSVSSNTCSSTAPGSSCTITVSMSTASAYSANSQAVTISGSDVPLSGYMVNGTVTAASGIYIVDATYGGNRGLTTGNRTTYVSGLCNGLTTCTIAAGSLYSTAAGGDPAQGQTKDLTINYRCSGTTKPTYYRAPEAGTVSNTISCP